MSSHQRLEFGVKYTLKDNLNIQAIFIGIDYKTSQYAVLFRLGIPWVRKFVDYSILESSVLKTEGNKEFELSKSETEYADELLKKYGL